MNRLYYILKISILCLILAFVYEGNQKQKQKRNKKKLNGTIQQQQNLRIFLSAMSIWNAVSNIFLSNFHIKERKLIIFFIIFICLKEEIHV